MIFHGQHTYIAMAVMTCHDLGTDSDRAGKPQLHLERTHAGKPQTALRHLCAEHLQLSLTNGHLAGIPQGQLRTRHGCEEEFLRQETHTVGQLPRRARLTQMAELHQQRHLHTTSEKLEAEPHGQLHPHLELRQHEAQKPRRGPRRTGRRLG